VSIIFPRGWGGGKGGQGIGLPNLQTSCAVGLEIWEPKTPETLKAFRDQKSNCFAFSIKEATVRRKISRLYNDICQSSDKK
jgi:hypothetical protein